MTPDLQAATHRDAEPEACALTQDPVQRVKFDVWLWERDIDNVAAAELFDSHATTIGRWRKQFGDPDRRVPPTSKVMEIAEKTAGEVTLPDWFRPCAIAYREPTAAPVAVSVPADEDDEAGSQ